MSVWLRGTAVLLLVAAIVTISSSAIAGATNQGQWRPASATEVLGVLGERHLGAAGLLTQGAVTYTATDGTLSTFVPAATQTPEFLGILIVTTPEGQTLVYRASMTVSARGSTVTLEGTRGEPTVVQDVGHVSLPKPANRSATGASGGGVSADSYVGGLICGVVCPVVVWYTLNPVTLEGQLAAGVLCYVICTPPPGGGPVAPGTGGCTNGCAN
ncbi:MAG: hypothetical protein IRZ11_00695 [Clostridia bacterium]|nr:hypothetical protein [Clostridia bacterium]